MSPPTKSHLPILSLNIKSPTNITFSFLKYILIKSSLCPGVYITSNLKSITNTKGANVRDKNWWTNITEFPITATLTLKGLSTYTLLLNYIKINVLYFGAKRSTSGMYIIVGQEDSLSGNGFKTKLDLLRVGGDNQYLTVDARVRT